MIDKLSYDDVLKIAKELRQQISIITKLMENREAPDLQDFIATVEGYTKFLETTVEINKDADEVLKDLKVN